MSLSTNLKDVALKLIEKYGNDIVLAHSTNDGVYDPQSGEYGTGVITQYNKKAYAKPVTTDELQEIGIGENTWGDIATVMLMVEDADIADLDNNWTIDTMKVYRVIKTTAQNNVVVIKAYCG
jgi:hypothetical protein